MDKNLLSGNATGGTCGGVEEGMRAPPGDSAFEMMTTHGNVIFNAHHDSA
jgi:hypothetical protein